MRADPGLWRVAGGGWQSRSQRSRRMCRLAMERLEDRRLLAVLEVGPDARYSTIQSAVDAARPGDEVLIAEGDYVASVDLSRMGKSHGGTPGDLLIRGDLSTTITPKSSFAFFNSAAFRGNLQLEQLTLGGEQAPRGAGGVRLQQWTGDVTVVEVTFQDLSGGGILLTDVTGAVQIRDSLFERVGDSQQDSALQVQELRGAGVVAGKTFSEGLGSAIVIESTQQRESTWLLDQNWVFGDASTSATTQTGVRVRLAGDSRTDVTLTANAFDDLAGFAVDLEAWDRAELQSRWGENTASTIRGPAAARLALRGAAVAAWLAEYNGWNGSAGSGVSVQLDDAAKLRAIVQYEGFEAIGEGADDGLAIASGPSATGAADLFLFNNSFRNRVGQRFADHGRRLRRGPGHRRRQFLWEHEHRGGRRRGGRRARGEHDAGCRRPPAGGQFGIRQPGRRLCAAATRYGRDAIGGRGGDGCRADRASRTWAPR